MITTNDILTGFLRNYGSLKIDIEGKPTSWTFKSMNYFNQLGNLLGYWVELEGHRYDLTWFKFDPRSKYYREDNLFFHLEHENNESRIQQTIDKLIIDTNKPRATKRVGIVYPDKKDFSIEVLDFVDLTVKLDHKHEEVTVLFFGFMQNPDENGYWPAEIIRKYRFKDELLTKRYKFRMKNNENEILYSVFKD